MPVSRRIASSSDQVPQVRIVIPSGLSHRPHPFLSYATGDAARSVVLVPMLPSDLSTTRGHRFLIRHALTSSEHSRTRPASCIGAAGGRRPRVMWPCRVQNDLTGCSPTTLGSTTPHLDDPLSTESTERFRKSCNFNTGLTRNRRYPSLRRRTVYPGTGCRSHAR